MQLDLGVDLDGMGIGMDIGLEMGSLRFNLGFLVWMGTTDLDGLRGLITGGYINHIVQFSDLYSWLFNLASDQLFKKSRVFISSLSFVFCPLYFY